MRIEVAGSLPGRAGRQFEGNGAAVFMVQGQDSGGEAAADVPLAVAAGEGGEERWEEEASLPGTQDGDEGARQEQPCLGYQVHDMEAADAPQSGDTSCSGCLRGSLPWRRAAPGAKKKSACPGLGLFYTLLSAFLFSVASLLLKKIEDVHSVEVSAFRCVFQMALVLPGLIYYKTGFLGPKAKRMFLFFRGLLGSSAMILLYYAFQVMPLADATVITFSSPVFTSLLAWIFLKEKYSPWDLLFTLFTITGVVLIARPPFLFGTEVTGIEGSYTDHLKGTIAAVTSAIAAASTIVILRKINQIQDFLLLLKAEVFFDWRVGASTTLMDIVKFT
ncbi:solute carrier family 35 member G1 isoform X2 [Pogona vitticeps]